MFQRNNKRSDDERLSSISTYMGLPLHEHDLKPKKQAWFFLRAFQNFSQRTRIREIYPWFYIVVIVVLLVLNKRQFTYNRALSKLTSSKNPSLYLHHPTTIVNYAQDNIDLDKQTRTSSDSVWQFEDDSVDFYDLEKFQGVPTDNDIILMLIPLRNAEHVLPLMFKHLINLDYPHDRIDLGFLVSDCSPEDNTLQMLEEFSIYLQNNTFHEFITEKELAIEEATQGKEQDNYLKYMNQEYLEKVKEQFSEKEIHKHRYFNKPFRSVQIIEKNFGQLIGQGFSDRHAVKVQGIRRKLMGRARNWLLSTLIKPYHSWVFWRDADIEMAPLTILQDLKKFNYDVMVPNVWRPLPEFHGGEQPYDLNTWIESGPALELAATLDEDDVIVEGYAEYPTWRVHLAYIREPEGDKDAVVDMDGVGGVSILAKAKVFRHGAHFPAFTFENHAETEAFGKMSKKMGFKVGGLPHYVVWHIYEPSEDDIKDIALVEARGGVEALKKEQEEKKKKEEEDENPSGKKTGDLGQ